MFSNLLPCFTFGAAALFSSAFAFTLAVSLPPFLEFHPISPIVYFVSGLSSALIGALLWKLSVRTLYHDHPRAFFVGSLTALFAYVPTLIAFYHTSVAPIRSPYDTGTDWAYLLTLGSLVFTAWWVIPLGGVVGLVTYALSPQNQQNRLQQANPTGM